MAGTLFISRRLPQEALDLARARATVRLNEPDRRLPKAELAARLGDVEALVCLLTDTIDESVLAQAPRLRVVANVAVGFDNIDVAAATRRKIVVTNTPGVLTETTADFTWALLLAAARRVAEADAYTRAGGSPSGGSCCCWAETSTARPSASSGSAGSARRSPGARAASTCGSSITTRSATATPSASWGWSTSRRRGSCAEADFVTLHVNLSPETRHFIGEAELRRMKPTAYLINAARGPVVDEAALVRALKEGWIAGAGLDVYEEEPRVHPGLLECPTAVLAPHIASASRETRTRMALMAVENCLAVLEGTRPPNPVNPEVLG